MVYHNTNLYYVLYVDMAHSKAVNYRISWRFRFFLVITTRSCLLLLFIRTFIIWETTCDNTSVQLAGVCECGKTDRCVKASTLCNCAADTMDKWQTDHIVIENKRQLPIREIVFGDLASSRDKALVRVSSIQCAG